MSNDGYNPIEYKCEEGNCFNVKLKPKIEIFHDIWPRTISMQDIDGTVELDSHFLFFEWKQTGARLKDGQRIYHENLTNLSGRFLTLVVWGNAETMNVTHAQKIFRGVVGDKEEVDLWQLKSRLSAWVSWVERGGVKLLRKSKKQAEQSA